MARGGPVKVTVQQKKQGMSKFTAEQRSWFFYDWANSAYLTTTATVLFSPYLTSVAERAACGYAGSADRPCREPLSVLGLSLSAGSLVFYLITFTTVLSALILPIVGAIADRVHSRRKLMGTFAWLGSIAGVLMFFVTGTHWQFGAVLLICANLMFAASVVVYDAILVDIAGPDERDAVSSQGWAYGYLGGGILLAANLVLVGMHDSFGIDESLAVRISMASAAVWWAAFTIIPVLGIRDRPPHAPTGQRSLMSQSFGQLWITVRGLRHYPQTLLFLVAYLFFNDGIQTVIYAASVYGEKQLGFGTGVLIGTILLVQFVAFGGALLFGRVAGRYGSRRTILVGLLVWMCVVCIAFVLPAHQVAPFLILAVAIGLVLGGTQALSRSFYSQLIPAGRAAEYFSLYQACERGTSWLGTLAFGVMHQLTGSYRPAILALIMFFAIGAILLYKVNPHKGIRDVGNVVPSVV